MRTLRQILSAPYPAMASHSRRLKVAVGFGVFVFLFLLIFQPFGLADAGGNIWLVCAGYGMITLACMAGLAEIPIGLFTGFYDENNWTVGKEIGHSLLVILLIAAGNFFFSVALGYFHFRPLIFLLFILFTAAVGIFPVTAAALIRQGKLQRKAVRNSKVLNHELAKLSEHEEWQPLELEDEDGRIALKLLPKHLICIATADNYVQVYHLKNGKLERQLIRNPLRHFHETLPDTFYRCHRSYLVNLNAIERIEGNARGYRLHLHGHIPPVPVARRRSVDFREVLKARSDRH